MAKRTFLAENIKYFRNEKRWTQDQLSARLGIRRSALGSYEEGRAEPNIRVVIKMSKLFETSVEDLVSWNRKGPKLSEDKSEHDIIKEDIHRKLDLIKHLVGDIEKKLINKE